MIQGFSSGLLNRDLIYQTDLPSFQRDFASLKSLDHGTGPNITFTRASDATYFDADGVLQTATTDTPRFDHDPATGASRGLLIEESRTNSIRNSQAGGSTDGVIGSGGALPTNWGASGHDTNGVSTEIIGTGTEDGLAYIDIKVSGTPTAGGNAFFNPESVTQVVAANSQTWTHSSYVKLAGGSLSNATLYVRLYGRTAAGAAISGQLGTTTITPTSSALKTQRVSTTFTFSDATVERAAAQLMIAYTSGNPIDLTLRIAAPQLEQGAFPTSYIPTTTAAATRAADSAVVTPISSFYNASEGTLFAEAIASTTNGIASVGNSQHAAALVENASTNLALSLYRQTSATNGRFFVGTSSGSQADISQAGFTAGTSTKLIGAYKQDDFALSVNGTGASTDTSGSLPSPTSLRIGAYTATGGMLNGHVRKIAYWPRRLTNTLLEQLTT